MSETHVSGSPCRPTPRRLFLVNGALFLVLSLYAVPQVIAVDQTPSEDPSDSDQESGDETQRESVLTERVTVTATRLPDRPEPVEEVPAHVSVIGRDQIERSAVPTLQDILGMVSSAVLYDQVGNDIQKTFDLRGFTSGTGTKVYLDGVPLNDPRNNRVPLYLVPLTALDRVELVRGSAAQTTGGGSEAGVINLHTRAGEGLHGAVSLAAGTFDATSDGGGADSCMILPMTT